MNERDALRFLADDLPGAGDDAAVIDDILISTDMLHESTDFPTGTTRYTAGWRGIGASLSDMAAMGARVIGTVAVYAAPTIDEDELREFIAGARDVCSHVNAAYVGGDLDEHHEFTVVSSAVGQTHNPVYRTGARSTDVVCVTGTLGRSGAALRLFDRGSIEQANELFRFAPRVPEGMVLAESATAMMDSSDGLARSLHQLAEANNCGFSIDRTSLPIDSMVHSVADDESEVMDLGVFFGEDFELVFTIATEDIPSVRNELSTPITVIGSVTDTGIILDGEPLPDAGYTHGNTA